MIDSFGRQISYLRLSVTELCNLRCRYCMPADGICKKPHNEMLTEEEMICAVEAAASLGITKLRITGGEPLVKPNILSICRKAAAVKGIHEVCLTTNGILLRELAQSLKNTGVKRVNISLDTLNEKKYAYITRGGKLDEALEGIQAALEAGFKKVKINTVLIGGFNDDEINDLAQLTMMYPIDVRFIEMMPMYDSGDFDEKAFVSNSIVLSALPELLPQHTDNGVAKLYRLPNAKGSIGLISPVSTHFCFMCNRLRLTADGKLKPCLHAPDEYSIKGLDFNGMQMQMKHAILCKPQWHGILSKESISRAGRDMNEIGG